MWPRGDTLHTALYNTLENVKRACIVLTAPIGWVFGNLPLCTLSETSFHIVTHLQWVSLWYMWKVFQGEIWQQQKF